MFRLTTALIILVSAMILTFSGIGFATTSESTCVNCHTDKAKLKNLTAELSKMRMSQEEKNQLNTGKLSGELSILEDWERLYIDQAMFEDENHGEMTCVECHKGDNTQINFRLAHGGISRDPSYPAPGICADCHDGESENYANSLHANVSAMTTPIKARTGQDMDQWKKVKFGYDKSCKTCHASCGACHISRPNSVGGGLMSGHKYIKPQVEETCGSCHGATSVAEYSGKIPGMKPDVHLVSEEMGCLDCHTVESMHGESELPKNRFSSASSPNCLDCHDALYDDDAEFKNVHLDHKGKASCQVCHSQAYNNCSGCHIQKTAGGETYHTVDSQRVAFFIGRNAQTTERHPDKFVTVRQVPVAPDTFKLYTGEDFSAFSILPTFKLATPHNIQRKTTQTAKCNNCHGNQALFLKGSDMEAELRKANRNVMAIGKIIPAKVKE